MLHERRHLALSFLAAVVATMPPAAIAGDTSSPSFEFAQAPPADEEKKRHRDGPKKTQQPVEQPQVPPEAQQLPPDQDDPPQQRVDPKKERTQSQQERQQERVREKTDRSQQKREKLQQIQQKKQEQQQERSRQQQERLQQIQQQQNQKQQEAERIREERQQKQRAKQQDDAEQARQNQRVRDARPPQDAQSQPRSRDEERRRFDRNANPPVAVPPPPSPAAGQPVVQPNRPREDARRSVRRDNIRESYRRAPKQQRSFDDLKRNRRERTISQGNLRVIEEPDRRVIVKQNNRSFIRHDESERFRRIAPDARTIRGTDGTSTTFMTRRGGVRIYDVSDRNGRLVRRYRRYPNGREVILIDNRRHYSRDRSRTRDVLIGAGIGLFIGSAIALAAPEIRIPRDEYIVDYGRASDDDLYEALTAPPIERLDRGYSLDEVRYSSNLRDRMRRIDLDTVTFDFGSWEVGPDQGRALDRLGDGINRVLQRNPDEIFMIEGHTDAVGSVDDNLTLSDRRAQSVAEILTTEYGVAPENLITQGYGEEQLKIPTDGPERLNRRIAVRRIGPLLSGQFEDERYSGAAPANDRIDDGGRGDEDLDDGPPDDRRTYDNDSDRYQDGR